MKNKVILFLLALGVTMLFSSCFFLIPSTHKYNFTLQESSDQTVTLSFKNSTHDGFFTFNEWNGIGINDTIYNKKIIKNYDTITITVPAGKNSFLLDVIYEINYRDLRTAYINRYEFDNFELQYIFEPGKKYEIEGIYKSLAMGFMGYEFYVKLYDTTNKTELLKEWMLGKK